MKVSVLVHIKGVCHHEWELLLSVTPADSEEDEDWAAEDDEDEWSD